MPERDRGDHTSRRSDRKYIKKAFRGMCNEEGFIDVATWIALCKDFQINLSDAELKRVFDNIDHAGSGKIDLDDFCKGIRFHRFLRSIVGIYGLVKTKFELPENYDFTKSTRQNYHNPNLDEFHGDFVEIRSALDRAYHGNYTKARQEFQDVLVHSVAYRSDPQPKPWMICTCGPMGAGKGYVLSWLSEKKFFPLESIVHVDPDHFKTRMPEWEHYVERGTDAGTFCHDESGYIAEIAIMRAMQQNQHVWVDGSLRDTTYYESVFDRIRVTKPEYHIAIFYVFCSEETIRWRAHQRYLKTGRSIPEALLEESLQTDRSLGVLTPKVDFVARIDNEGATPVLAALEVVDRSGCFSLIRQQFARTGESPSRFPTALAPLLVLATPIPEDFCVFPPEHLSDDHVGSLEGILSTEFALSCPQLAALCKACKVKHGAPIAIQMSPRHAVNLDPLSRSSALIPEKATTFAWCYPPTQFACAHIKRTRTSTELDAFDPVTCFFVAGGFVYFDLSDKIVAVTAVGHFFVDSYMGLRRPQQQHHNHHQQQQRHQAYSRDDSTEPSSSNTPHPAPHQPTYVQFSEGKPLPKDAVATLDKQQRWHPVALRRLLKRGAVRYAWIRPMEKLGGCRYSQYGAFAFQVKSREDLDDGVDVWYYEVTGA